MSSLADQAAVALGRAWTLFDGLVEQGWSRSEHGLVALVTEIPIAALNGVWVIRGDADVAGAERLLMEVADSGMPYCLQARGQRFAEFTARFGMVREVDVPLMVLADPRPRRQLLTRRCDSWARRRATFTRRPLLPGSGRRSNISCRWRRLRSCRRRGCARTS